MEGWVFWMLAGFAFWFFVLRRGACSPRKRHREQTNTYRESEDVARLKAELEASHGQVDLLTRRIEALETILTDQDRNLRRQFDDLQRV
ncbi:MAG: hypothetical protein AAF216_03215 [Pseudomonadota bacterium]